MTLFFKRVINLFKKGFKYLKKEGLIFVLVQIRSKIIYYCKKRNYKYGLLTDEEIKTQKNTKFSKNIKFSILVPLYNTPINFLNEMIESVIDQTYDNWELCIADASDKNTQKIYEICKNYCDNDSRIKYKKIENVSIPQNTNECALMATGEYIALFDHDDVLSKGALYEVMKVIEENDADYIYSDEAIFKNDISKIVNAHFKPDFSPDTLRSYNYICHFSVFKKDLFENVGMFREGYNGSQDYDLALRLSEKAKKIVHIDKVLYFWRIHENSVASGVDAKPYTVDSGKKALKDHLQRIGLKGEVLDGHNLSTYRIKYKTKNEEKVSILIPNKDHIDVLKTCIDSIYKIKTNQDFEIIIIENNSENSKTFDYYKLLEKTHSNIKVVEYKGDFNYSKINNFGAKYCTGEYLLFLNNDVEVLTDYWLEEMVMFAQREDVGGVGCKLIYPDDKIQHAGVIIGIGGFAGHANRHLPRESSGYLYRLNVAQNYSACTAACLMVKKSIFDEINGFDEDFVVALNDVDLCLRIREKDKLIVYTPYAELYHYESKSRGYEDTPEKKKRFNSEVSRFKNKWKDILKNGDPYYNSNLALDREDFSFK